MVADTRLLLSMVYGGPQLRVFLRLALFLDYRPRIKARDCVISALGDCWKARSWVDRVGTDFLGEVLRVSIGLLGEHDGLGALMLLVHEGVPASVVLNRKGSTCPGPGFLWIWGMRYDRSGDFSLEQPKVLPFFFSSKPDFTR